MPVDSGIYRAFAPRPRSIEDVQNGLMAQDANRLQLQSGQLQYANAMQGQQEAAAVRNALMGVAPDAPAAARIQALRGTGTLTGLKQAQAMEEAELKSEESRSKIKSAGVNDEGKRTETIGKTLGQFREAMSFVRTPEQMRQLIGAMYQHPLIGETVAQQFGPAEQAMANVPEGPEFGDFLKKNAIGFEKYVTDMTSQRGQNMTADTAKAGQDVSMRGQDMTASTAIRGQDRQSADNAASRGVQLRGQNLTDARTRESTQLTDARLREATKVAREQGGKPPAGYRAKADGTLEFIPGGPADPGKAGDKPLNDGQSKALLFGTRMQESHKILAEMADKGTEITPPGLMSNGVTGAMTNVLATAKQQKVAQAKRDFLNAVLRRESGAVIAQPEFDNGDKQYFPQIGDSKAVKDQKKKNRELAINGILQEVPEKQRASVTPKDGPKPADKTVKRTGTSNGRKVVEYNDGSIEYAD